LKKLPAIFLKIQNAFTNSDAVFGTIQLSCGQPGMRGGTGGQIIHENQKIGTCFQQALYKISANKSTSAGNQVYFHFYFYSVK
jgi:hypothetical protein